MTVVTLDQAKAHLRVEGSDEDTVLNLYIEAAHDYIGNYLNNANFSLNASVKAAALLIVGDMYENREGAGEEKIEENPAVKRLLNPYREGMGV